MCVCDLWLFFVQDAVLVLFFEKKTKVVGSQLKDSNRPDHLLKRTKPARYWKSGITFVVDPHAKKSFQIHSGLR